MTDESQTVPQQSTSSEPAATSAAPAAPKPAGPRQDGAAAGPVAPAAPVAAGNSAGAAASVAQTAVASFAGTEETASAPTAAEAAANGFTAAAATVAAGSGSSESSSESSTGGFSEASSGSFSDRPSTNSATAGPSANPATAGSAVSGSGTAAAGQRSSPWRRTWRYVWLRFLAFLRGLGRRMAVVRKPLGLMVGGAAVVLSMMVGLLAFISIERSEAEMARLLAEKGSSLIMAFEGILRSGMRSEAGVRLQVLLEEMAASPDIDFVAVTMPDGTIVAHSQRHRLGEILQLEKRELDEAQMRRLAPTHTAQWDILRMEGQRVFVVYRYFAPGLKKLRPGFPLPVIFLGMDISPFELTRRQNRDYVAMLASGTLLLGLLFLLALYYAQSAHESRQRQRQAEGKVRRLEEEMRRKEKMAAVGNLAAGVAHEIRNPLSSIKGYATYFGQRFPEGSEDREAADVMVREVDRLNRVITDLIGLSRPSDVCLRPVQLEPILQHVLCLIRQDAEQRGVEVKLRVTRRPVTVLVDAERMGQVLLNLCINALDAMPQGGVLTLGIARTGQRLCVMVHDTGTGIKPEDTSHIFNPYYTTKGHGTGLGLAMVHKIVAAHRGGITVYSRPADESGHGETVFRIWLPLPNKAEKARMAGEQSEEGARSRA